jgi:hypothetical protein
VTVCAVIRPDGIVEELLGFPGDLATHACFRGAPMNLAVVTLSGSERLVAFDWPRSGLELTFSW